MIGIYYLTMGKRIVYVGQSTNIEKRIQTHIKENQKKFDGHMIKLCDKCNLNVIEESEILKFSPKYNIRHNSHRVNVCSHLKIFKNRRSENTKLKAKIKREIDEENRIIEKERKENSLDYIKQSFINIVDVFKNKDDDKKQEMIKTYTHFNRIASAYIIDGRILHG